MLFNSFAFCFFAWIFFVSDSIGDVRYAITHMFRGIGNTLIYLCGGFDDIGLEKLPFLLICLWIALLAIYDLVSLKVWALFIIAYNIYNYYNKSIVDG